MNLKIKQVILANGQILMNVSEQELKQLENIVYITIEETLTKAQYEDLVIDNRLKKELLHGYD